MTSAETAAQRPDAGETSGNLVSIRPFFIVKELQASITHYIERFGFQLDFQGPRAEDSFVKPNGRVDYALARVGQYEEIYEVKSEHLGERLSSGAMKEPATSSTGCLPEAGGRDP